MGRALVASNDRPDPSRDGDRTPQKYASLAQDLRDSAWRYLDEGDLPQASNKAWGLVAETIKDIAAQHGAIIHRHHTIIQVVSELARLVANTGDLATSNGIITVFQNARNMLSNFYENELSENMVIGGLMTCEELSALLYQLFGTAPAV